MGLCPSIKKVGGIEIVVLPRCGIRGLYLSVKKVSLTEIVVLIGYAGMERKNFITPCQNQ